MKYQNGVWYYRGRVYATLHDALVDVWGAGMEVRA